jgi:hypothetical protein
MFHTCIIKTLKQNKKIKTEAILLRTDYPETIVSLYSNYLDVRVTAMYRHRLRILSDQIEIPIPI